MTEPHEIEVTKEMIAHGMRAAHENAVPVQAHELAAIYQAMEAARRYRERRHEGG